MYNFIRVRELVAVALILLKSHASSSINTVSLKTIYDYGNAVSNAVEKRTGHRSILLYSNVYVNEFLRENPDMFELVTTPHETLIHAKNGVTEEDLRQLAAFAMWDILVELYSEDNANIVLKEAGIDHKNKKEGSL